MTAGAIAAPVGTFAVLHRIRAAGPRPPARPRCDLCAADIDEVHGHLVDVDDRQLRCACRACALLFPSDGTSRFRLVPDRYRALPDFSLSPGQWDALQVPVSLVWLLNGASVSAFYPGPAGATESLLDLEAWASITAANPMLLEAQPEVEAILIQSLRGRTRCFIVPIDRCYELVGRLRTLWRGFDGGQEVHAYIDSFLADLAARARG